MLAKEQDYGKIGSGIFSKKIVRIITKITALCFILLLPSNTSAILAMRLNFLGILLLSLLGLLLVYNLPDRLDLRFGDETTYLGSGLSFSIPFKGGAQWGPIYAAWYAFWNLFISKALDLYYFNWALLSVLAGVATFLFFRSLQVSFWASTWLAALFMFSGENIPLDPKISIFPFSLLLLGLFVIQNYRSTLSDFTKFVIISSTALVCSYARPEFYLSFLIGAIVAVIFFIKEGKTRTKSTLPVLISFVVLIITLHGLFKNPMLSGDGDRSAVAFQQHFVTNYCIWNNIPEPPTIQQQLALFHKVLGKDVETVTDALVQQPAYTFKHLTFNLINTLKANLGNLTDVLYKTLWSGWSSSYRSILYVLILLPFLIFLDYKKTVQRLKQYTRNDGIEVAALLILLLPSLIASLLIFPRVHYLVFHLLVSFRVIGYILEKLTFKWPTTIFASKFSALSIVAAIALALFVGINYLLTNKPQPTPTADSIRYITQLNPKQHLNVLERHWYRVFLPYPTTWVQVEEYTDKTFVDFIHRKNINFILMTADMQTYFANDPGFNSFLSNYKAYGFEKNNSNSEGAYLLSKKGVF